MRGKKVGLSVAAMGFRLLVWAQTADGNAGLSQADSLVRGYYQTATNLMYAIGGVVAIIGAIRVYTMWSNGEPHMGRVAAAWFSGCIFLVIVATVIKSFFGIA